MWGETTSRAGGSVGPAGSCWVPVLLPVGPGSSRGWFRRFPEGPCRVLILLPVCPSLDLLYPGEPRCHPDPARPLPSRRRDFPENLKGARGGGAQTAGIPGNPGLTRPRAE